MEFVPVVVWWLAFVALAATGLPIASVVLGALPDRGAGLAIPTAILVLVLPVYWIGQLRYGPSTVAIGILILAGTAALAARVVESVDWRRWTEALIVFTLAFALLIVVRSADPSIYAAGGEKFLDYGLLNAILRADRLPPEDLWFAGEPVQYYYGGQLIAAIMATATTIPARYAYNLALAGTYGVLVSVAYGLGGTIVAARDGPYRIGGAVSALLVGLASNLVPPLQAVLWALPSGVSRAVASLVADRTALAVDDLVPMNAALDFLYYWTPSRVIEGTINEFPLFAFINGDLHAHMSSTPFLGLVIAVAYAYFLTPASSVTRRRALAFLAIPPIAGLLAVVNTWSFPSAIGIAWLALVFAPADPATLIPARIGRRLGLLDRHTEPVRAVAASIVAAAIGILGVLWAAPFFLGPAGGRAVGVFPDRSGLLGFVLVHGAVLVIFSAYLGIRASRSLPGHRNRRLALVAGVLVLGVLLDAPAVAILLPLGLVAWVLLRRGHDVGFETVLFVAGAGLVLIVEFLYVIEEAGPGRFNTVFKTYMQVWVLWGIGAGAALTRLWSDELVTGSDRRRRVAAIVTATLLVSVSIYAPLATSVRVGNTPDHSLDATLDAARSHPGEWEAIQYLDREPGTPVIVTAPACWCNDPPGTQPYTWTNAPSTFTGLPTVAGWAHEIGYRDEETYMRRVDDVGMIYTGPWSARVSLLEQYDVEFVYVGPAERRLYGDVTGFEGRSGVATVFENRAVTIYRIDHADLAADADE